MPHRLRQRVAGLRRGRQTVKVPQGVLSSARYIGNRRQWQMDKNYFLLVISVSNELEGEGEISRETLMRLSVYRGVPQPARQGRH